MKRALKILIMAVLIMVPLTGFSQDGSFLITQGVGNFFIAVIVAMAIMEVPNCFYIQFLWQNREGRRRALSGLRIAGSLHLNDCMNDQPTNSSGGQYIT